MQRRAIDRGDQVAWFQAESGGGRAGNDLRDAHPLQAACEFVLPQVRRLDAEESIFDLAAAHQRFDGSAEGGIDGHGVSAGGFVACRGRQGHRKPDHFAAQIQQRAAAGAEAELGVGLDQSAVVVQGRPAGRIGFGRRGRGLALEIGDDPPRRAGCPSRAMA